MRSKIYLSGLIEACSVVALSGVVLGLLGKYVWLFDLLSHFRAQFFGTLLLCGIVCLLFRTYKYAAANFLCAILLGLSLLPLSLLSATTAGVRLKVINYNVQTSNSRYEEVVDFLRAENADIVFIMEPNDEWIEGLQPLSSLYPHRLEYPREDNFGVLFLSRHPIEGGKIDFYGPHRLPGVSGTVTKDSETYAFVGVHALPPMNGPNSDLRNQHLLKAASLLATAGAKHRLLFGDFNLSPYSPWFGELLRAGQVESIAPGYSPTWMRGNPLLAIPIDHILTSSSLSLLNRRIGPSLGSDHNPIITEVAPKR